MLKFKADRRAEQAQKLKRKSEFRQIATADEAAEPGWDKPKTIRAARQALASIGITEITQDIEEMLVAYHAVGKLEAMVDDLTPLESSTPEGDAVRITGIRQRRGRNFVSDTFLHALSRDFDRRQPDGDHDQLESLVGLLQLDAQMRVVLDPKNPSKLGYRQIDIDEKGNMRLSDKVFTKALD